MLGKLGAAVYRGLFWTYERGTWQYDVMVALILAFIFLTPRAWFHDRPSLAQASQQASAQASPQASPQASGVVLLSSNDHEKVYQLRAALLELEEDAKAEDAVRKGVERVLQTHIGKSVQITQIKPEMDARGQVVSYAVWVQE